MIPAAHEARRTPALTLRPFAVADEAAALVADQELRAEGGRLLLDYVEGEPWDGYIARLEAFRRGERLPAGRVPFTVLAATVEDRLVGSISIRHELNDWLAVYGGHIGYAIVPSQRRKGYATETLRQGLLIARSMGINEVLVTCDEDNIASARVIEKCGGEFESMTDAVRDVAPKRRYWIR